VPIGEYRKVLIMKIADKSGFEYYLNEALKMKAETDFAAFGEFLAGSNSMSDELLEEMEREEPVKAESRDVFQTAGDFLGFYDFSMKK
jgi:hypothetical protein